MVNGLIEQRKGKFENYKRLRDKARLEHGSAYEDETQNRRKENKKALSEDLFIECPSCKESFSRSQIRGNLYMCPGCKHHFAMPPEKRIKSIVDEGSFKIFRFEFPKIDPLEFEGYLEKKEAIFEKNHYHEAVMAGVGQVDGRKVIIAVMNSKFLMGSMGIEVGETITRTIEAAEKYHLPLLIFTASGGARMQEGILSLMQMAKTSAAMERFQSKGGLYIACLTHPTTGGVSASFAGLGDITLAEPNALIGFAGPRVIQQTIGQKLPEGFQRAEYLETHGFVDQVVSREELRCTISQILKLHDA